MSVEDTMGFLKSAGLAALIAMGNASATRADEAEAANNESPENEEKSTVAFVEGARYDLEGFTVETARRKNAFDLIRIGVHGRMMLYSATLNTFVEPTIQAITKYDGARETLFLNGGCTVQFSTGNSAAKIAYQFGQDAPLLEEVIEGRARLHAFVVEGSLGKEGELIAGGALSTDFQDVYAWGVTAGVAFPFTEELEGEMRIVQGYDVLGDRVVNLIAEGEWSKQYADLDMIKITGRMYFGETFGASGEVSVKAFDYLRTAIGARFLERKSERAVIREGGIYLSIDFEGG